VGDISCGEAHGILYGGSAASHIVAPPIIDERVAT
jgi:hypothetical protein